MANIICVDRAYSLPASWTRPSACSRRRHANVRTHTSKFASAPSAASRTTSTTPSRPTLPPSTAARSARRRATRWACSRRRATRTAATSARARVRARAPARRPRARPKPMSSCRSSPLSGAVEITVKDADGGPLVADGVVGRATATLGPCGADPFEASVVSLAGGANGKITVRYGHAKCAPPPPPSPPSCRRRRLRRRRSRRSPPWWH